VGWAGGELGHFGLAAPFSFSFKPEIENTFLEYQKYSEK
jgi:hypothetical protein